MVTLLENTDVYKVKYHKTITNFPGCRCNYNCNCENDYIPRIIEYYTVFNKLNKKKTNTRYDNLEQVSKRLKFLKNYYENK
jgi:hypothetical protein